MWALLKSIKIILAGYDNNGILKKIRLRRISMFDPEIHSTIVLICCFLFKFCLVYKCCEMVKQMEPPYKRNKRKY